MARGIIRKPSFNKIVGAYRSQWKRFWMRLFTFGMYGRKGMGWWRDPKKAWYNFWYHRTSISVYRTLGCKPSRGACFFAMLCASVVSIFAAPVDATRAGVTAHKIKRNERHVLKANQPERQELVAHPEHLLGARPPTHPQNEPRQKHIPSRGVLHPPQRHIQREHLVQRVRERLQVRQNLLHRASRSPLQALK